MGIIELPTGGKLPPPPSFLMDGKEVMGEWKEMWSKDNGAKLYITIHPTTSAPRIMPSWSHFLSLI